MSRACIVSTGEVDCGPSSAASDRKERSAQSRRQELDTGGGPDWSASGSESTLCSQRRICQQWGRRKPTPVEEEDEEKYGHTRAQTAWVYF